MSFFQKNKSARLPKKFLEPASFLKLIISVIIDILGFATYAIPVIGEIGDIIWAPFSAWLLYVLYGNYFVSGIGLAEEIAPGTDFVPTATLAWVWEFYQKKRK